MRDPAQDHYNIFLAMSYSWMAGDREEQVRRNREFFSSHVPGHCTSRTAVDLGAGSGFQSIALAELGYSVIAVDFCQQLLDELRLHAGTLQVETIHDDILNYSAWVGRHPALIVCMGDTLTHMPSAADAADLIRQCFHELAPGGRLVLAFRDYSCEPDGEVIVIPVQRDMCRIFLCRLDYHADTVSVRDILYSRRQGTWTRSEGTYTKIRIAPGTLAGMITGAGFTIDSSAVDGGIISVVARKGT